MGDQISIASLEQSQRGFRIMARTTGEILIELLKRKESVELTFVKVNLQTNLEGIPEIPGWGIRLRSSSGIDTCEINVNCEALQAGTPIALKAILDTCDRLVK